MQTFMCPRHPDVHSDRAGQCPKCGGKLEMKQEEQTSRGGKPPGDKNR
ncbi:MAG TPA: heavy metal-binding domain-containing protein [Kofleriaceae bacterium]|nr:heavy metal-binding domain-containing protein [Kofleriaceae bacterium]